MARASKQRRCRVIVLSSPKGGTGKTTFSMNFLTLAATSGLRVVGIDFDPQESLLKWFRRRQETASSDPGTPMFDVDAARLGHWQDVFASFADYDLAVIDMLPSVDHVLADVHAVCEEADLVLVPTKATANDLDSTIPWVSQLIRLGFNVAAVFNQANPRETMFKVSRQQLNELGPLCPVEVRSLTDAHIFQMDGLCAADRPRSKAADDFGAVWSYVKRQIRLPEPVQ